MSIKLKDTANITANSASSATSATKATQDSAGQQINTTYIKGLSVSGKTITYTKGDGSTGTITTQDTNTTYSAATQSAAGLMSAADKKKLDGVATSANNYSHPNSGVTAASYGPSANASPAHSGTFSVPYITVNSAGHITAASTKTITLPADNNTWRPIQNNLTSTATDQSLSANQGKVLKGLIDSHTGTTHLTIGTGASNAAAGNHTHSGYASSSHTHTNIVNQDTRDVNTAPGDVPIGLSVHLKSNGKDGLSDGGTYHSSLFIKGWNDYSGGPFGNIAISENNNLWFRSSSSGTAWNSWKRVSVYGHTHKTFDRDSAGDIGWGTNSNHDLPVSVRGIAYWNGAYSGTSSNLAYCKHGAFGTMATKNSGDYLGASATAAAATKLATARTLTIGATGKSFNGTADVTWSLKEIMKGKGLDAANACGTLYFNNAGNSHVGRLSCYNDDNGDYVQIALYNTSSSKSESTLNIYANHARFSRYVIFNEYIRPNSNGSIDMGASSYRWRTVYSANGVSTTSDRTLKENIKYVRTGETEINYNDMYNFVKNDLELATYNYINSEERHINFIAQDLLANEDGTDNKVGQFIINPVPVPAKEDIENGEPYPLLSYNTNIYTSVLAGALKESIDKIEEDNEKIKTLENEIKELETKNKVLEELVYSINERLSKLEDK
jgi:hypothetical protein